MFKKQITDTFFSLKKYLRTIILKREYTANELLDIRDY